MDDNAVTRFLGGKPGAVILKLAVISVIVGALLHLAGLSPVELFRGLGAMIRGIVGTGWDAVSNIAEFALYGAMVVVPIWLIARALAARKP
ncbi:MAG: integrase [Methylocystis sp.]|nr:integrase [Methylocystis sp.]MCA3583339.1 integrase [Methylocystis sp.]MCA3588826.1 integrase [Methylocystis sp.]MCA3591858.1 integrase [Methylocystis sp.]